MDFHLRAEKTVNDCCEALDATLTDDQRRTVSNIIEKAIIDAIRETSARSTHAATRCCSEDMDMAHKITEEIRQAQVALISNLISLR